MAQQIDITPASNPALGIHFHSPAGLSASAATNPTDFPATPPKAPAQVTVKVAGTQGSVVRFSNPS